MAHTVQPMHLRKMATDPRSPTSPHTHTRTLAFPPSALSSPRGSMSGANMSRSMSMGSMTRSGQQSVPSTPRGGTSSATLKDRRRPAPETLRRQTSSQPNLTTMSALNSPRNINRPAALSVEVSPQASLSRRGTLPMSPNATLPTSPSPTKGNSPPAQGGTVTPRSTGTAAMGGGRHIWTSKKPADSITHHQNALREKMDPHTSGHLNWKMQTVTQVISPPTDRHGLCYLDYSNDLDTHAEMFSSPEVHAALSEARKLHRPRVYLQYCSYCQDHACHLERAWEVLAGVVSRIPGLDYSEALPPHLPFSRPIGKVSHFIHPEQHKCRASKECEEMYMICVPWGKPMKTLKITDPLTAVAALQNLLNDLKPVNLAVTLLRAENLVKGGIGHNPKPYVELTAGGDTHTSKTSGEAPTRDPDFGEQTFTFWINHPEQQTLEIDVLSYISAKKSKFLGRASVNLSGLRIAEEECREVGLEGKDKIKIKSGTVSIRLNAVNKPFEGELPRLEEPVDPDAPLFIDPAELGVPTTTPEPEPQEKMPPEDPDQAIALAVSEGAPSPISNTGSVLLDPESETVERRDSGKGEEGTEMVLAEGGETGSNAPRSPDPPSE